LKKSLGRYTADGLVVAFSGGVDSGFLVWAAEEARREFGGRLVALTTNSESMPKHDKEDVTRFINKIGVEHVWKRSSEMDDENYLKTIPSAVTIARASFSQLQGKLLPSILVPGSLTDTVHPTGLTFGRDTRLHLRTMYSFLSQCTSSLSPR